MHIKNYVYIHTYVYTMYIYIKFVYTYTKFIRMYIWYIHTYIHIGRIYRLEIGLEGAGRD